MPQAYLKRFGRDPRIAVRWRDRPRVHVTHVKNIAGQTGFYNTYNGGMRSVETEHKLAAIDAKAHHAINAVVQAEQAPGADSKNRNALSRFLAVQMSRTPETRERLTFANEVLRYAADRTVDEALVAEYLEGVHLGFRPDDREIQGALVLVQRVIDGGPLTQTDAVDISMWVARRHAARIFRKHWSLEIADEATFITSDAPLVMWRTPSVRDNFEGIGLNTAEEIRFPLDPHHQLVLTDADRKPVTQVDAARVAACNQDLASACHRFILGHPDQEQTLLQIKLAGKRPTLRFNIGPGYQRGPDGRNRYLGEVVHYWVQRHDRADAQADEAGS